MIEFKKVLGIEFGSTRIKAVLVDEFGNVICDGAFNWENSYVNGIWTYSLNEVLNGLQKSYFNLSEKYIKKYGEPIRELSAIGISAMMHGYLAFGKDGELLTPFRTWRNTITAEASNELTDLFKFNIPQTNLK